MSLEAKGLSYSIANHQILTEIHASFLEGQVNVLAGPNGAGKTTLLKALCGEINCEVGGVTIDGRSIRDFKLVELSKIRSVMTQSTTVVFDFSVAEILEMSWLSGSHRKFTELMFVLCENCEIKDLISRKFRSLSGGEKQRVLFVRALLQVATQSVEEEKNQYIFLDEPTASLDVAHELKVLQLCREQADNGFGVIIVLHDLNLASRFADRIFLLDQGQIRIQGSPEEVLSSALLTKLYGTQIIVEKNELVNRLVVHS